MRTKVDFPEPFGPITAHSSPAAIVMRQRGEDGGALVADDEAVGADKALAGRQTHRAGTISPRPCARWFLEPRGSSDRLRRWLLVHRSMTAIRAGRGGAAAVAEADGARAGAAGQGPRRATALAALPAPGGPGRDARPVRRRRRRRRPVRLLRQRSQAAEPQPARRLPAQAGHAHPGPQQRPDRRARLREAHRRPLTAIPKMFVQAVVAAEDADYFKHGGVDYWGMARAFIANVLRGRHGAGRIDDHAAGGEEPAAHARADDQAQGPGDHPRAPAARS